MRPEYTAEELLEKCIEEETICRFPDFSKKDAWKLGCILAELAGECPRPVAVEIKLNGLVVFAHYPDGASEYYHMLLTKKHNTVNFMEKSSLRFFAENAVNQMDPVKDMHLDGNTLQFRGGGFPISLTNGCVIGSIAATGMAHTDDHGLIVRGIRRYLELS